jgi:hypothetical protein
MAESAKDSLSSFINELEEVPVDPSCSIDNPECEACGS